MASAITDLKTNVTNFAGAAKKLAPQIKQLELDMNKQIALIEKMIGGASDSTDKQLIAALQEAKKSLGNAALSMLNAGDIALRYANKL